MRKLTCGYHFVVDAFPERRWRRWEVRCIGFTDERGRRYRCFTYRGAERLKVRLVRRAEHMGEVLGG